MSEAQYTNETGSKFASQYLEDKTSVQKLLKRKHKRKGRENQQGLWYCTCMGDAKPFSGEF